MSPKKNYPSFIFFRFCIVLTAVFASSLLLAGISNNNFQKNTCSGSGDSSLGSTSNIDLANDSIKRFVRFDHTDGVFNFYSIRMSMFNSSFERGYFYEAAKASEIYMKDKSEFDKDSTLFMTGNTDKTRTLYLFSDLYEQTINTRRKLPFSGSGSIKQPSGPLEVQTCDEAMVSCTGNVYSFPSGTTGNAPPPVMGYPNYGCLGSEPCPAYYYMQVSVAGDIIIFISQVGLPPPSPPPPLDVDFICWGPFTSLTEGCATGLTGGNIVDCSYSGSATETCHITNAQVGELYILLITNFSQQPGTITFQQTGGTGITDCNIVVHCSMIAMTINPSTCDGLTNTFSLSGNVEFSNPPLTGTLTVTDNTAVPPVSQTLLPPFISPQAYNLTGIPCDGAVHSLTAAFSDSVTCTMTEQFTSPPASCPQAHISGGGEICNDGVSTVPVSITLTGIGPFDFTYAINGIPQPAINNYSGPSPYVMNTSVPGTYTLVSVTNPICGINNSGAVSGSATVVINPLPLPTLAGLSVVCAGTSGVVYSTQAGMTAYNWTVSIGGSVTSGGTDTDNTVTVTWNTPGARSVSINYHDPNGCTAVSPFVFPVTVTALPVPTITGNDNLCEGTSGLIYSSQPGMTNYIWMVSAGGMITAGGTVTDNTITVTWNAAGPQTVSVNYNDADNCTANAPVVFPVTVHPLPVPILTGTNILCAGTSGVVYSTQPNMTNYQWTVSAGGIITTGGTVSDHTVTVTWNAPGAQNVFVNFQDVNGCTALAPVSYPVTVNPLPVPVITGPTSICLNSTGTYTTAAGMTNYTWNVSPGGTITSGAGTNSIDILWNTIGTKTITVNYNDANGCTAASATSYSITVTLLPEPVINGLSQICVANSTTYTTDAGMTNYSWTISAGGFVTSGGGTADNTVTVQWTSTGSQSVSVNYQMGPGCIAPLPSVLPVTVKPKPAVTNAANFSVCSATTLSIVPQADLPLTVFSWTAVPSSGNVTGFNSGSGVIISDHLINTGFNIETVTYAVLPSLNGCDGSISDFIVTVDPVADVTFTPNGQTFCSGGTTNISLGSHVAGAAFTWSATGSSGNITGFGPGAGSTLSQMLTNTGFNIETATYHVLPTANNCQGITNDVIVTVSPIPSVVFSACTDITTTTDAKPFPLRGGLPLGGTYSGTGVNSGIFYPSLAGTGTNNILYSYTNTHNCTSNATLSISVIGAAGFTCGNTLTDVRDNEQYPTVRIGNQCWMAANLKFGSTILSSSMQRDNCVVEKYCFNDNMANCFTLGGLYQWDEMMQFDATVGKQGLCPPAWHLPSENEWNTLFNYYTSSGFAGSPLKLTGYSGFNAQIEGVNFFNRNFFFDNFAGLYWSSDSHGPYKAWAHGMNSFNPSVSFYPSGRSNALSVRCIKD